MSRNENRSYFDLIVAACGAFTVFFMLFCFCARDADAEGLRNGIWTDDVVVYYLDAKGWHWRKSAVEHISGANVFFCFQLMPKLTGTCFYNNGSKTAAVDATFPFEDRT